MCRNYLLNDEEIMLNWPCFHSCNCEAVHLHHIRGQNGSIALVWGCCWWIMHIFKIIICTQVAKSCQNLHLLPTKHFFLMQLVAVGTVLNTNGALYHSIRVSRFTDLHPWSGSASHHPPLISAVNLTSRAAPHTQSPCRNCW